MNGEGQSQQPHKAPTEPDPANAQQAHQAPATPHNGNQSDNQSSSIKSGKIIGVLGTLIGALLGFFFGVASNQVADFVRHSDDCVEALDQYVTGVSANFLPAWYTLHNNPRTSDEQHTAAATKYANLVDAPYFKISAKCPVNQHNEYLDQNKVKDFLSSYRRMDTCIQIPGCPNDDVGSVTLAVISSAQALVAEAQEIPTWGLFRRAKYVVTHLY